MLKRLHRLYLIYEYHDCNGGIKFVLVCNESQVRLFVVVFALIEDGFVHFAITTEIAVSRDNLGYFKVTSLLTSSGGKSVTSTSYSKMARI